MSAALPAIFPTVTSVVAALGVAMAANARLDLSATPDTAPVIAAEYGSDRALARTAAVAVAGGRRLSVPRAGNGMFYAPASVNGHRVQFLVDTGATTLVLSRADARAMGIDAADVASRRAMRTVGGEALVDLVRIDRVEFAGRTFENVEAAIVERGVGAPLLGQALLARFDSLSINRDTLTIE